MLACYSSAFSSYRVYFSLRGEQSVAGQELIKVGCKSLKGRSSAEQLGWTEEGKLPQTRGDEKVKRDWVKGGSGASFKALKQK